LSARSTGDRDRLGNRDLGRVPAAATRESRPSGGRGSSVARSCEEYCEREVDEVEWQGSRRTGILAPDEMTHHTDNRLLAAAVRASVRGCEAHEGRRQSRSSGRGAARLLPAGASGAPTGAAREHFACSWLTRPPESAGSRSAFPLQSESRCVSGGLVSSSTMARRFGGVNANAGWPVDDVGDNSGMVVDGPGLAVDNPVTSWGRPLERETSLLPSTCPEAAPPSCGQEKVADVVS
jgi:hypothetical protein